MDKRGLTLVEVIVAALILAVTTAGMLATFLMAKNAVARAGRQIQALESARQRLEVLKNEVRPSWDDSGEPLEVHESSWEALAGELYQFSGQRKYKVEAGPAADTYKKVTVTVDWTEPIE